MGKIIEAELRITGSDKSGAAFAGVIKHAEEMRRALGDLNRLSLSDPKLAQATRELSRQASLLRTETRLANDVSRAYQRGNRALAERAGLLGRVHRHMEGMLAGMGMYGWMTAGFAAGKVAHSTASDVAAFEHQRAMLANTTGMKPGEVSAAVAKAQSLRIAGMSATDNLKAIGELRMVFGSTAEAIKNAAAVQRAAGVLQAVNPEMNAHEESYNLARALELKGVSMDPEHFKKLTNSIVQAVNASRGKVTGASYFEFTQYARGSARNLSDFFYSRIAPTLLTEMRPTSAGRAISSLYEQVIGGKMKLQAATEWMKLGLLDPHKVELNKIGNIKRVQPGAFVNSALFVRDPYAWIQGYLAPALKKHGITDKAAVSEELAHLFSNMYAEQLAGILLTQKARIEKDIGLAKAAPGAEALNKLRTSDPLTALRDLDAGVNSLLSAFGSPLAGAAVEVMNKMADGARAVASSYADLQKRAPWLAKGISTAGVAGLGYIGFKGLQATFGLLTGSTALKGSAAALTQSAAALDAAAAKLGSVPSVKQSAPASSGPSLGGWGGAFARQVPLALQLYSYMQDAQHKAATLPHLNWKQWLDFETGKHTLNEMVLANKNYNFTIEDIRHALGTPKAELTGEAHVKVGVEVKTEPGFWSRISSTVSGLINHITVDGPSTGTTGSRGETMPEVLPNHW